MQLYTQAQNATHRLRIFYDESPDDPREHENLLGTMVGWHPRYTIGDAHSYACPADFLEDVPADTVVRLPVFLLEHGAVRLSTGSFRDPWDSGQVGWIFVTLAKVCDTYGVVEFTPEIRARAARDLRQEVTEFGHYLNGDVFGYVLERAVPCGCDPDCDHPPTYDEDAEAWGFYGTDFFANNMTSYLNDAFPEYTYRNLLATA